MTEELFNVQTPEEMMGVLDRLFQPGISDIFLGAEGLIDIRKHGEVCHTNTIAPTEEVLINFLNATGDTQIDGRLTDVARYPDGSIDGAISASGRRYRYNFYRALDQKTMRQTANLSLRPLSDKIPSPEQIGLPMNLVEMTDRLSQGLILVCGKTGQGKSTTLASILQHRADTFRHHILTLEQPIEYVIRSDKSRISQREVGSSVSDFAVGLRAALRQNPDTILVGEIRDNETAGIALAAAESGHIVFGTLHTSNAAQSVERFVNIFATEKQNAVWNVLSTALKAIVCQILVKGRDGMRVAAREILIANNSVSSYIKTKDINGVRRAIESGYKDHGMVNWIRAAEALYRAGHIKAEEKKDIEALGE